MLKWDYDMMEDELYRHVTPATKDHGEIVQFYNVSLMVVAMAQEVVPFYKATFVLTEDLVRLVSERGGIELSHLESMDPKRMEIPVIVMEWPDHTHSIIDGGHRAVKRWLMGKRDLTGLFVQYSIAQAFLIDKIPEIIDVAARVVAETP